MYFCLNSTEEPEEVRILEKYTFSNAIATSVKLGMLEAKLDRLIDSLDFVTSDLKRGNIHMTQVNCCILTWFKIKYSGSVRNFNWWVPKFCSWSIYLWSFISKKNFIGKAKKVGKFRFFGLKTDWFRNPLHYGAKCTILVRWGVGQVDYRARPSIF